MKTALTALALTFALAAPAAAQDGARPRAPEPAPDTSYDFDDHTVDGGRYVPTDTWVPGRGRGARRSLVRPRVHFVNELVKSVETF